MIYLFLFYWVVCGLSMFFSPDPTGMTQKRPVFVFAVSMFIGGFFVPARIINKVIS